MEIELFIHLISDIENYYKQQGQNSINKSSIEEAHYILLADKHEFEWRGSLWEVDLSLEEALGLLKDFDFTTLNQLFETEETILPQPLLISYKVKVKSKGLVWVVHRYDADPFPSMPHAHQLDNNIKLDLSNGKCYHVRSHVHSITKKELIDIRDKVSKVFKGSLPPLSL